jgi:sec-independent protein translocase protein TatA
MAPSFFKLLIVALLVVVVFGRGKIPDFMGDIAKGIKNFKDGLKDDEAPAPAERKSLDDRAKETIEARPAAKENFPAA